MAYPAAHFAVADGKQDYAFVYINVKIAEGRSAAAKTRAGDAMMEKVKARFAGAVRQAADRHHAADRRKPRPGLRRQAQQPAPAVQEMKTACHCGLDPQSTATNTWIPAQGRNDGLMFSDDAHRPARGRTPRKREVARAGRALLQTLSGHDRGGRIRHLPRLGGHEDRRRAPGARPQDRPDFARDADLQPDRRAGLRHAAGRHVLRARRHPHRPLHRAARGGGAGLHPQAQARRRARQRGAGAGRHRIRHAGHRDHRRAHRAVRPPHQGDAQGAGHHQRQRGQRRHRARRAQNRSRRRWTCPGAARSCARMAPSRKRAWPPACRATPRSASPGWR